MTCTRPVQDPASHEPELGGTENTQAPPLTEEQGPIAGEEEVSFRRLNYLHVVGGTEARGRHFP